MPNPIKAIKTIRKESKRQKSMKAQSAERNAYNKMQRGGALKGSERRKAANFVAKGMPKPKYR